MSTATRLAAASLVAAALCAAPTLASAANYDIYGNPIPVHHPHKIYLHTSPRVEVPAPVVIIEPAPKPRPSVIALPSVRIVEPRDPYDTGGIVIAGGGFGGMMLRADGRTNLVPTYRVHLGAAIGQSELALRLDMAPGARDVGVGGVENNVDVFATRLSFNYRFLPSAVLHPVAGFGLEHIAANPDSGAIGHAFALAGRAGLEFAYPLAHSALAVGIDATAHIPIARSEGFPLDLSAMVSFGAYADFRF
ncbi:MAG: hypothetical protein KC503_46765 [Myxococcales bacterium]|nr:hypothetical protein [Myxococcales bacterium]